MNNNQLFDEQIKDQLGNYSPPVDPRIWNNIVAGRERNKPAGFWYMVLHNRNILLFAALLIAGGTGALYIIKKWNAPDKTTSASNVTPTQEITASNTPVSPLNITPVNITSGDPASTLTPTSNAILQDMNSPVSDLRTNDAGGFFPAPVSRRSAGNTAVNTIDGSLAEFSNTGLNVTVPEETITGGTLLGRLNYLGDRIEASKKATELSLRLSPFGFQPGCPTMEKNASGNKKYFEIYGGIDYAIRSLKDTGNSAYLQKRKESTRFTSAYSAGMRYTRVFNNSMSVRVGVNYSQINEKFTYSQGGLIQITYIIDANGDTTGSYITTGTRYKTTHNKYRSIDIPLVVGYELGNGRLHANINAGAVINVYSWQRGEVLDTSFRPVNISTGKGSSPYQFKTNAGVGFVGAVSVYYKLNDKFHVMVEPYYRHNFSPMNKDENLTIKQKYNTIGVRAGIRLDLR